ncbi:MAG: hypothetical protein JWP11_3719 [Frankiales bacterium]|nr:hypothetical protein [Frankiales bacterium]
MSFPALLHDEASRKEQALREAGEVIARDLAEQERRSPRDAALAALGRHATGAQITAWISQHRPAAPRQRTSA